MQVTTKIRRSIAAVLLTAGLAYPACAAVCPKGIGGCPSPGRCFLFIDADTNSLCDYTGRTGSQGTAGTVPSQPGAPAQSSTVAVTGPANTQVSSVHTSTTSISSVTPDTSFTAVGNSSTGGFLNTIHLSAAIAEVILFLVFTGLVFALIRIGFLGTRVQGTLPALALSSFFGLGLSLITTCVLAGSTVAGTVYALIYMAAGTLLVAYLWHKGVMTRQIVLPAAALGTLAGFVFIAPIMPMELGGIVSVGTGASALTAGVLVICAVIVLTLAVGRTFCGSICPVGSLQDLAYSVPGKKIVPERTKILELVRLVIFVATAIAAIWLIDLMAYTGLYDLFSLTISSGLLVAFGLVLVSVFVYRPVCRILCPFGVLFSMFAEFSWFRLWRTGTCTGCKKCERACPASAAGKNDSKRECYLCGRCTEVCPVETALRYGP
ncbi:4Fe-4S binding protein [uncultured Methanoregula sp.]|uniref:4Fe-4S binding protein n=1 Tax=uncultured Methanoregula sp. TaxID=1005933 RepID=UPI002AAB3E4F|nr:4Fe-4S binding protein [uncultured Methanoregula sp.]